MYTATEVATERHVFEALKHGIDILWIGARTTANPFAVQEIANALKGVDIPVLIKNPVNPDLELWIGAVERIYNAGLHRLAVIHRGLAATTNSCTAICLNGTFPSNYVAVSPIFLFLRP